MSEDWYLTHLLIQILIIDTVDLDLMMPLMDKWRPVKQFKLIRLFQWVDLSPLMTTRMCHMRAVTLHWLLLCCPHVGSVTVWRVGAAPPLSPQSFWLRPSLFTPYHSRVSIRFQGGPWVSHPDHHYLRLHDPEHWTKPQPLNKNWWWKPFN